MTRKTFEEMKFRKCIDDDGKQHLGEINDLIVTNLKTMGIKSLLCQTSQNQWLNENIY